MSATDTRAVVQQLHETLARLGEHYELCDAFNLDDEGRHCACDCGLDAALTAGRALLAALSEQPAAPQGDSVAGSGLPLDTVRTGGEVVVPSGWKLVPVEPTLEMWKAADEIDDRMFAGGSSHGAETGQIWEAMLDAAPTLPLGAVSVPAETASGARPQDEPKRLTDAEIDEVERELLANGYFTNRKFARAILARATGGSSNE